MGLSKLMTRDWPTRTLIGVASCALDEKLAFTDVDCAAAREEAASNSAAQTSATRAWILARFSMVFDSSVREAVSTQPSAISLFR